MCKKRTKGEVAQLKRVLQAIYHSRNYYLLHLDLEASSAERLELAKYVKYEKVFGDFGNVIVVGKELEEDEDQDPFGFELSATSSGRGGPKGGYSCVGTTGWVLVGVVPLPGLVTGEGEVVVRRGWGVGLGSGDVMTPLIVPDQKVAAGAFFNAVVRSCESTSMSVGPNEGCVPADTLTLKSVEVQNVGFQSERDSTLEAAKSLLFIKVAESRAIVMAHVCPAVTKSGEV
ncbi:hypothetical protein MTR_4g036245 [Medicago truncatula]|uniref:Uncharacterized protein n=1 Tax=Medicago truncatula TaxID=3880 RepID=A0A072UIC9_MEDTR|nr:hypothetical protein MTR_4g036245 [Medicago truncatula]